MQLMRCAMLMLCLFLAGCFDIKQSYVFSKNGEVDFTSSTRIKLDAAFPSAAGDIKQWCSREQLSREGLSGSVKLSSKNGEMECAIAVSGAAAGLVAAIDGSAMLSGGSAQKRSVQLEKLGSDEYALTITVPALGGMATSQDPAEQKIIASIKAQASGRALTWTISAPKILEANGKIDSARRKVTFTRPLTEILESRQAKTFKVRFSLRR